MAELQAGISTTVAMGTADITEIMDAMDTIPTTATCTGMVPGILHAILTITDTISITTTLTTIGNI